MEDCIFCKIVAGDIPNHTVYEDNQTLSFLDVNPIAKGHTLVVPKVHAETVLDLNDELAKTVMPAVQKTMERIQSTLAPDGFNIGINHHEAGGQVVPHLHIHILPRWEGDGGGTVHSIVSNPGDINVEKVAELFA